MRCSSSSRENHHGCNLRFPRLARQARDARARVEHDCIHAVLRRMDDVRDPRHSAEENPRPERHRIRPHRRDARAHRLADPRAARHLDRPLRRTHRVLHPDARHRRADLADLVRDRALAVPRARPVRRARGRLVLGRHALRRALVPESAPGSRDGRVRRRQLGRGRQQVRRARADRRGGHMDHRAARLRGRDARDGAPLLAVLRHRSRAPLDERDIAARATARAEEPARMALLAVLLGRVRRLRRAVAVAHAVLRRRIRLRHPVGRVPRRVLLAAGRRAARDRRMAFRPLRRVSHDVVGDVGLLGDVLPAQLSADRFHDPRRARPARLPSVADARRVHRAAVRGRHRDGGRQGVGLQVHRRRVPERHRRGVGRRRPRGRPGRLRAADSVRRARRPHGRALDLLHAALRRRQREPRLDVLQLPRRACRARPARARHPLRVSLASSSSSFTQRIRSCPLLYSCAGIPKTRPSGKPRGAPSRGAISRSRFLR
ncbi:hypothetical protein BURPS1710b_2754 [Burkholderia pseudomallei 1710b]|uniref:Uncharacterized protein n=1 Tax=Burkholderia pseudomallei (strain 1710b) TaxID=320372 RepID=Q3JQL5_BURP1|nr:hypothetical protein BURPS1710b_2754 [Burkholderia pseudomallei 1710b]